MPRGKKVLTPNAVYAIRALTDQGVTRTPGKTAEIAQLHGVSPRTIENVGGRRAWWWLPEAEASPFYVEVRR